MHSKYLSNSVSLFATIIILAFTNISMANDLPTVRVGVLSYGTINWEIDTIKHHELDKKLGINVEAVKLTTKNAAAIALQGKAVDVILTDLFWVIKQGGKFKMHPTHKLSGGLYAKAINTQVNDINTLGVAGGANDKNLLVYKAYLKKKNQSLTSELKYGAPPLLNEMMLTGKIDGLINFWHYNARLDASGFHNVLTTQSMLTTLNIKSEVPLLGWVFHRDFVDGAHEQLQRFIKASQQAKKLLLNQHADDWARLKPKMKAKSEKEYLALIQHYPSTIITDEKTEIEASAKQLFDEIKGLKDQNLFQDDELFPQNLFID